MNSPTPWHHIFGSLLKDFFTGTPVTVEMEKDLSLKRQLLDIVLLHKTAAALPIRLPDGFDELAAHNLVGFKSFRDTLDGWALNELVGHYVNYRKQSSPSMQELLPEMDFRLFAVSARFPQGLTRRVELTRIQRGVYEVHHFTGMIRVIVVSELPLEEHNAILHVFSGQPESVAYGKSHYRQRSAESSTILNGVVFKYQEEGVNMSDAMQQFVQEAVAKLLKELPPEERLKGLPPEERLKGLSADFLRAALPPEERLKGLSTDELLASLSPEARADLTARLKDGGK